jgi:hypothetical protein
MVYVVVSVGETTLDPFTSTDPMPGETDAEVASVEAQFKVEDSPEMMAGGSASMLTVGGLYTCIPWVASDVFPFSSVTINLAVCARVVIGVCGCNALGINRTIVLKIPLIAYYIIVSICTF